MKETKIMECYVILTIIEDEAISLIVNVQTFSCFFSNLVKSPKAEKLNFLKA